MEQSMLAAVSGIEANQSYIDTVGSNIANANTDGYKAQSADFVDLLSQAISGAGAPVAGSAGGINPMAIGTGTRLGSVSENWSEGSLQQTNQPTDVAIQGSGLFVAKDQGSQYFTRAGNLKIDANGDLTTATGALIQGWQASGGVISTNGPTGSISIPQGLLVPAKATQSFTLGGNLPAWSGSGSQGPVAVTINAYDSLGDSVPVTLTFTPVSGTADQWTLQGTVPGASSNLWSTPPTVTFDPTSGELKAVSGATTNSNGSLSLPVGTMPSNYTFPTGDTWNIDFPAPGSIGAVTQYAGQSTIAISAQDGNASGSLSSFSIGSDGVIMGSFSNGGTEPIGQLALANFTNVGGLQDVGNLLYTASANSGQPQIGPPESGGRGSLVGGSLEASNVDMAQELTDLVMAQEAYQANTKVISTSQQALQSLVNMP